MPGEYQICLVSARLTLLTPQTTSRLRVNWAHPVDLGNERLFGPPLSRISGKSHPQGGLSITITQSSQCGHQQVSSKNPHLATQRYSRDTPVQRHVSNEACAALGHVSDDRTRQHVSNDRLRPTDVHAALLWAPGHCRAFTSASTALPAEFLSSKGLRKLAPAPS